MFSTPPFQPFLRNRFLGVHLLFFSFSCFLEIFDFLSKRKLFSNKKKSTKPFKSNIKIYISISCIIKLFPLALYNKIDLFFSSQSTASWNLMKDTIFILLKHLLSLSSYNDLQESGRERKIKFLCLKEFLNLETSF